MSKLNSIQRYLLIIRKIKSTPYIPLESLHEEVCVELTKHGARHENCSQRTIERDIHDLKNNLGIPITYSRTEKGYYFPETEPFSEDSIDRLLESFDLLNSLHADTGLSQFVYPEQRPYRGTQHLSPLIYAIRRRKPILLEHKSYQKPLPTTRILHPYALKENRNRWYLIGIDTRTQLLKTFGLDRIRRVEIQSGKFRRDPSIDIPRRFTDLLGIFDCKEAPVEEIILSFNTFDGEYVKSLPIHHSQRILKDSPETNELVVSLRLKVTKDLHLVLISRGASLQVLQPQHLREEISRICRNLADRNS